MAQPQQNICAFWGQIVWERKFYFIATSQTFAKCLIISISLVYNAILCCYFSNKKQIGMNKGDWLYEIAAWFIILFVTYLRKQWYHKSAFYLFVMSLQKSLNTLQRCINLVFLRLFFNKNQLIAHRNCFIFFGYW